MLSFSAGEGSDWLVWIIVTVYDGLSHTKYRGVAYQPNTFPVCVGCGWWLAAWRIYAHPCKAEKWTLTSTCIDVACELKSCREVPLVDMVLGKVNNRQSHLPIIASPAVSCLGLPVSCLLYRT
jgi:hypothetical protein